MTQDKALSREPRDTMALAMFAAWVNSPIDKLPAEMLGHTCASTMEAWGRVAEAARAALADDAASQPREEVFPQKIGQLHLSERTSDGERLCSHSHAVPAGHPLYWPERMGEYPDDIDPLCLEHAIDRVVDENSWCECSASAALHNTAPTDQAQRGEVERLREALRDLVAEVREFLDEPDRNAANSCGVFDKLAPVELWLEEFSEDIASDAVERDGR